MFERNPVDNKTETQIAVELTLADGSKTAGRAVLGPGKGVHKLLEGGDTFIFVEGFDGEGTFVPKAGIRSLKVLNPGRPQPLINRVPDARHFEPYAVLGLEKGATFAHIRDAYHRLSKLYHPDRYANVELPPEVAAYMQAMSKMLNAAFHALKHVGEKTEAIYTRPA